MAEGKSIYENIYGDSVAAGSNDYVLEQKFFDNMKYCEPCRKNAKKTTADKFCKTCSEFQCLDCSSVHNKIDSMKGHCLVVANASNDAGSFDMKEYNLCKDHNKPMEFYCGDCDTIVCPSCGVIKHRGCNNVQEIQNIDASLKTSNYTLRKMTVKLKEKAEVAASYWENADQSFHDSIEQLPQKINAAKKAVTDSFDRILKSVESGAITFTKTINSPIKQNLEKCNQLVDTLNEYIEMIDNVNQFGNPDQKFILKYQMQNTVQATLEMAVQNLSKLKTVEMEFLLKKKTTIEGIIEQSERPGYVKLKTTRTNIRPFEDEVPMKLEHIRSVDVTQERNEYKEPLYTGMDFLPDGRLVAVDNKNAKLKLFDENLKNLSSFKLPTHPTGIVVIRNEIAIPFANPSCQEMHFYFVDENNVISFVRKFSLPGQFSSIYVMDDDKFVMTTINGSKPVRTVSVLGHVTDLDLSFPVRQYGVDESACAYIKNDAGDKLVLLASEDNVVIIYDMKTDIKNIVRNKLIVNPRSVAICPSNTILVATVDRIVQLSPSGRILTSFVAYMANCRSICISKENRRLAVTNAVKGSKMMTLFEITHPVV